MMHPTPTSKNDWALEVEESSKSKFKAATDGPPLAAVPSAALPDKPTGGLALMKCGQSLLIAALVLGGLLGACWAVARMLYYSVPEAQEASNNISTVVDLDHIKRGLSAMHLYVSKAHSLSVLLFSLVFTIKMTFSIPGATPLCILAGALFPWWEAVLLCSCLVITGSVCSFFISKYVLSEEVLIYLGSRKRVDQFRAYVDEALREKRLFWAMLGVRLFPLTPSWVINSFSPHVNVPLSVFSASTLGGNLPYVLITTAAGDTLGTIKTASDILTPRVMLEFSALAAVSCLPAILKRRRKAGPEASVQYNALKQEDDDHHDDQQRNNNRNRQLAGVRVDAGRVLLETETTTGHNSDSDHVDEMDPHSPHYDAGALTDASEVSVVTVARPLLEVVATSSATAADAGRGRAASLPRAQF
jgi:uncharacterized membrane protein YdjX (TVP38/TMEM64 family)